jgi:hypothetical protein
MTVKQEILQATHLALGDHALIAAKLKDIEFVRKLVVDVSNLPDEEWDALSDEAHAWVELSVERINHHQPLVGFDGSNLNPIVTLDMHRKKRKRGKQLGKMHPCGVGTIRQYSRTLVKQALIRDVNLTLKELHQLLRKERLHLSDASLVSVRDEFAHSFAVLKHAGWTGPET